jgi:hypothetical protein
MPFGALILQDVLRAADRLRDAKQGAPPDTLLPVGFHRSTRTGILDLRQRGIVLVRAWPFAEEYLPDGLATTNPFISHKKMHRGAESAKVVVPQRLSSDSETPRCRQTVARIYSVLQR